MFQEHTIAVENNLDLPEYVQVSHPLEMYNASDFTPAPYDPTENVIHQHDFTRLGHTNNFNLFLSGLLGESEDIKSDYIVGVCAAAMLIFGVALLWFMVIVGLKIAGKLIQYEGMALIVIDLIVMCCLCLKQHLHLFLREEESRVLGWTIGTSRPLLHLRRFTRCCDITSHRGRASIW